MSILPVIVIHGGAWAIPDSLCQPSLLGVQKAASKAYKILATGGSAIDAVETALTTLEDDPTFDAGTGSVLTSQGTVEMDAIIMEGSHLGVGAVACVENIKNPIKLARLVMEKTRHTMLMGRGAQNFAVEMGMDIVAMETLVTPQARVELEYLQTYQKSVTTNFSERQNYPNDHHHHHQGHETVGCVAMDTNGQMAAATSTGGITGKWPGRVGDSPLVGCGAYCDNFEGAASTTGHGESITKCCLARRIVEACGKGQSARQAITAALSFMRSRVGQAGGAICINGDGVPGIAFNSERMPWAIVTPMVTHSGINPNEVVHFQI